MLNDDQTHRYLARLGLDNPKNTLAPTEENLNKLIYAHQTCIPFETVGVHRGEGVPDVQIDAIYEKIIENGNGGYCFELNKLFEELLSSLGYDVRPVLSRVVRGRDGRMPINHRGIIVSLPEGQFLADVGFGGPMPAGALMLNDGVEQVVCGDRYIVERSDHAWWKVDRITNAERDFHDDNLPERRQTELELCTAIVEDIDFDSLNLFCSQPGTLFKDHELVNLRTDNGYKAYRDGVLTIRENGKKTVIELDTDKARDAALEEHFGIRY